MSFDGLYCGQSSNTYLTRTVLHCSDAVTPNLSDPRAYRIASLRYLPSFTCGLYTASRRGQHGWSSSSVKPPTVHVVLCSLPLRHLEATCSHGYVSLRVWHEHNIRTASRLANRRTAAGWRAVLSSSLLTTHCAMKVASLLEKSASWYAIHPDIQRRRLVREGTRQLSS